MKLKSFRNILSGLFLLCIVILAIVEKSGSHIATRSSPVATIAARNSSIKPVDITVFETIRIANSTTGNGNSSVQVQSKLPSPTVVAATEILPSNVSIKPVDIKAFQALQQNRTVESGGVRKSKNLLDWIGFGSGSDDDPYLASVNGACFEGVLSECLKYRALSSLDYFFDRDVFTLNDNVKVVRMPAHHLKQLKQETFEFSTSPRADEPEWDRFVKFLKRRVEFFVKSTAIEVQRESEEQPLSFKDQSYISSDISSSSSAAYQNRPNVNSYYSQQLAYKGYRKYEKR
ncbi:hypothetical protein C0J52_17077 [Blattella germanica]|nr:hypothetical protein C0J52_17077 [Blattella germanica]